MLCEGAAADWSANYLHNELGAGAAMAGLGYAAYALAMVAMRLSGTVLQRKFRNVTLLPMMAFVFAVGISVALIARQPAVGLIGFAAMGLGLALIVPSAFSAAGVVSQGNSRSDAGSAIATVAALGWFGYVSGPPLIGHLADLVGLGIALWLLPVLALAIAATVRFSGAFAVRSIDASPSEDSQDDTPTCLDRGAEARADRIRRQLEPVGQARRGAGLRPPCRQRSGLARGSAPGCGIPGANTHPIYAGGQSICVHRHGMCTRPKRRAPVADTVPVGARRHGRTTLEVP